MGRVGGAVGAARASTADPRGGLSRMSSSRASTAISWPATLARLRRAGPAATPSELQRLHPRRGRRRGAPGPPDASGPGLALRSARLRGREGDDRERGAAARRRPGRRRSGRRCTAPGSTMARYRLPHRRHQRRAILVQGGGPRASPAAARSRTSSRKSGTRPTASARPARPRCPACSAWPRRGAQGLRAGRPAARPRWQRRRPAGRDRARARRGSD